MTIYKRVVLGVISAKRMSPRVVSAMPSEAITRGSILSESLPARGENTAITIGWAIKTTPAPWGLSPLIYCR